MRETEAIREFKEGMDLLRNAYAQKALPHFCKASELDLQNALYRSYMGLALGKATRKWDEAEDICRAAVRMKRTEPELYLNLAQLYCLADRKADAVETLQQGLHLTRQNARLSAALQKLGLRQAAVVPFLARTNPVNRKLGKLRHRVMKSLGKEA